MKPLTATVVVALALLGAGALAETGSSVVARGEDGRVVAREELPGSGGFQIEYVHSYYRAPAVERFVAEDGGGFALVEISSTNSRCPRAFSFSPGRGAVVNDSPSSVLEAAFSHV